MFTNKIPALEPNLDEGLTPKTSKLKHARSKGSIALDISNSVVDWIGIIFFLGILLFCIYALYDSTQIYSEATMPEEINEYISEDENGNRTIDLEGLRKINGDIVGWLTLEGTNIDYPILQTSNDQFYLSHNFKKEYSAGGSIFVTWQNNANLQDDYNLIYGHNMNGDMVFGQLRYYSQTEFFNEHKTGKLYTFDGEYDLTVNAELMTLKNEPEVYNVTALANNLDSIKKTSREKAGHFRDYGENNKILALSTCFGIGSGSRQVVFVSYKK